MRNENENRLYTIWIVAVCLGFVFAFWFWGLKQLETDVAELEIQMQELETKIAEVETDIEPLIGVCGPEWNNVEIEPTFYLSDYERDVAEAMVAGEAGNQSLLGKMAVAQSILNACLRDNLQPSEVRVEYRYSGWAPEWETLYPMQWKDVELAVRYVFDEGQKVTEKEILWFYNPELSEGKFHNTQNFLFKIDDMNYYSPKEDVV